MIEEINWEEIFSFLKFNINNLIRNLIYIILVLVVAVMITKIIRSLSTKAIDKARTRNDDPKAKSFITFTTLLNSVLRFTVYFAAFCLIANQLGFGSLLSNLLTAAGVGALIISLGAQSVISDIISGLFILFEKQFDVGDLVCISDYTGTVTSISMRCTCLETWKGERIIIPNGQIKNVINYSDKFIMAIVDVPTPYEEDSEKVLSILKEVADEYYEANKAICYDKPNVVAISSFDESAVTMSIYIKAKTGNQFTIQRGLKMAVKKRFDKEGISIPYQQIVVHNEG